ncbi:shewanella-like protein phosphatase 2 [Salvia miltiorrhiza]|uniref:shewanella-like protein phosphatase 2 n=1 Tax=Salvia miltiorrhiza TaxID=226208 RepID=UPI0025ACFA73|nr:shewanella-like protein phosphatase 2 [Salvia miltiorrhiza]
MDCATVPSLISDFVNTFVDFSVSGGIFLPPEPKSVKNSTDSLRTVFPQPARLIAVGDIHGDLPKAKSALRLAGLIGPDDRWSGESATVVQVGDIFDRGGDEIKLLYFFERLKREAAKAGGTVITMNGNHEIMNVDADFRFVARLGVKEFEDWGFWQCVGNGMKRMCLGIDSDLVFKDLFDGVPDEIPGIPPQFLNGIRARIAALRPNGLISNRFLSKNQTVVVVGDSVFAHGGLLEKHVVYGLERMNEEVRDWIRGLSEKVDSRLVRGADSVVWLRSFSNKLVKDGDCSILEHVLETIPGARRMIMGHTIQEDGINVACGGRAVRVDVGMSKLCGDRFPEVLEIDENSELKVLTSNPLYMKRHYETSNKKDGLGSLIPDQRPRQVEVNA